MEISETGKAMLAKQADLADSYQYKSLLPLVGLEYRQLWIDTLPECFAGHIDDGEETPIYSLEGTLLANGYSRIVVGDYGAFVEIAKKDIIRKNIKNKEGQEYRFRDAYFADKVKYYWLTAKDNTDCKIYLQRKTVEYADYKPDYFYISPFECTTKKLENL